MRKKILYLRSGPYELDYKSYNLQEVGLGKAFCKRNYDFDIIYFSKQKKIQNIKTRENDGNLRILWTRGLKILRTGVYPSILKKEFLNQYDAIIVSEYSQIMSVLVSKKYKNTYLLNGPYYNLFKLKFLEGVYDKLFTNELKQNIKKIFCKTNMSATYLKNKGLYDIAVTGVGLDVSKFDDNPLLDNETAKLVSKMKNKQNLVYVGSISKRKNVEFLIKVFNKLKAQKPTNNIQLILIGTGSKDYVTKCKSLVLEEYVDDCIFVPKIDNAQLSYIYQLTTIFLLASTKEIFGMVLLEAMYFGIPVISSYTAGADTLIKSGYNGIILNNFKQQEWSNRIQNLLDNLELRKNMGNAAKNTVKKNFSWEKIANTFIKNMDL